MFAHPNATRRVGRRTDISVLEAHTHRVMEVGAMVSDTFGIATVSALQDRNGTRRIAARDLRLEVLEMRQRLKAMEDAAARNVVMRREADHRIKNSLQLVSSLMNLQARRETSTAARDALLLAATRVSSIGSIHDALQVSVDSGLIDLGGALGLACASLQRMAGDAGHIGVAVDTVSLPVSVTQAQPLILAVNELVVNALRHAFPGRDSGLIQVSLTQDGDRLQITVADDGVGLPADYANSHGYGMSLVTMMMKQAGADLRAESRNGSCFTIDAPIAPAFHAA
jgi:two-component sensor histidine kinase